MAILAASCVVLVPESLCAFLILSLILFNGSYSVDLSLKRLFQMINELPTIFEIVTGNAKQSKDHSGNNNNNSRNKPSGVKSRQSESLTKVSKMSSPPPEEESEDEDEDDEHGAVCGACGDNYGTDEFWICCDACEKWFHGKCVKITPAKAEHIKHYKCPSCSNKRARP